MDTPETDVVETPKPELKHAAGKFVVGGIAAFFADRLAVAAYDKALHALRARKVR